jgi:hypothetical protein
VDPISPEGALEPGEEFPRVFDEGVSPMRELNEAPAATAGVGADLEKPALDQTADQIGGGLAGVAEPPSQLGRRCPVGVEMSEDQGLRGGQCRPPTLSETVEELPVEPPAGPEQQEREGERGHG